MGAFAFGLHGMVFADALQTVNAVRQAAGLSALKPSEELQQAAQAHADYLAQYLSQGGITTVSAHEQSNSVPGFTGELAPDRAAYYNYPHSLVTENISVGNKTLDESISALMSAIYHRFAFLDPQIDQLGYAETQRRYVFNMGQSGLAQACRERLPETSAKPSHDCLGNRMKATAFDQLCQQLPPQAI